MSAQLRDNRQGLRVANGEAGPRSIDWKEHALKNSTVLKAEMEHLAAERVDTPFPHVAYTIVTILSALASLKEHKDVFERLALYAATLIVVAWGVHRESAIAPPRYVETLVRTVNSIYELLNRKIKRSLAKRMLFYLSDVRKLEKYQKRIESVAEDLAYQAGGDIVQALLKARFSRRSLDSYIVTSPVEEDDSNDVKRSISNGPVVADPLEAPIPTAENGKALITEQDHRKDDREKNVDLDDHSSVEDEPQTETVLMKAQTSIARRTAFKDAETSKRGDETDISPQIMKYKIEHGGVQSTSGQVTTLAERRGSTKKVPKSKAPARMRAHTAPASSGGSISNFTFTNSGQGTMRNRNVGNLGE